MSGQKLFSKHQPLLSIVGLTATGKTKLSLWLAKQIISENKAQGVTLISADSRQLYQGLEILTGADVPSNFSTKKSESLPYSFFKHSSLPLTLHGVSLIYPNQSWSAAHFRNLAIKLIRYSWNYNYLPIIVGGTGFYHQQLFNNDPDIYVKPNPKLRKKAEKKSVASMQQYLKKINKARWQNLNQSDKNNPRRLLRAIEISLALKNPDSHIKKRPRFKKPPHYLQIGLKQTLTTLNSKIKQRVLSRFTQGAIQEVEQLLKLDLDPRHPVMTACGVSPIKRYLENELTGKQAVNAWTQEELQYAKRQLTWWKKYGQANWFKASNDRLKIKDSVCAQLSL